MDPFAGIDPARLRHVDVPSPAFVVNEVALEENLRTIAAVQRAAGVKILLALKGFAMWSLFDLVRRYLPGVTASSVNEATLGKKYVGGEVHVYAPVYGERDLAQLLPLADHISFNSLSQWQRHQGKILQQDAQHRPACALRINPEHSEVATALYDPCAPGSRLGIRAATLDAFTGSLEGISGLHFHTLCQANSDALERTLTVVEKRFASLLPRLSWINLGGGHHITRTDYDVDRLVRVLLQFRERHGLDVYLEPGEAVALNAGVLVSTVEDVLQNGADVGVDIAMLDISATAHMPDVLEMPYRPPLRGAGLPGEKPHTYRLGGLTCLAGDVVGDFSFDAPLRVGDRVVFGDMAIYSMVKTTMFNGVHHPAIAIHNSNTGHTRVVRTFGYADYRDRLS